METEDFYDRLGVPRDATGDDIKKAYRALVVIHHPDKGGDPNAFNGISDAYTTLSDAEARARYDRGEDTGFVDTEAEARQELCRLFQTIVSGSDIAGLERANLIKLMQEAVREHIGEQGRTIRNMEKEARKIEKVRKRLNEPEDLLHNILNDLTKSVVGTRQFSEHKIVVYERMLELIAERKDTHIIQPEETFHFTASDVRLDATTLGDFMRRAR